MTTPIPSKTSKATRSSCTSARGRNISSRRRLGTPFALRLHGAASRIRYSNPLLNPRTHSRRGGVHEEADPEQVGFFFLPSDLFYLTCRHVQTGCRRNRRLPAL